MRVLKVWSGVAETGFMALFRVLAVLWFGSVAWAQVGTPPPCQGAITDREVFQVQDGRIKFHLKFRSGSGVFDSRSVVKLHRRGAPDVSCNDGDVLDRVIDELIKERNQFLPQP